MASSEAGCCSWDCVFITKLRIQSYFSQSDRSGAYRAWRGGAFIARGGTSMPLGSDQRLRQVYRCQESCPGGRPGTCMNGRVGWTCSECPVARPRFENEGVGR